MNNKWYYLKNGQRFGPFTIEQFRQLALSGLLQPDDMVLEEATGKWISANAVSGLFPSSGTPRSTGPSVSEAASSSKHSEGGPSRETRREPKIRPSPPTAPGQVEARSNSNERRSTGANPSGPWAMIIPTLVVVALISLGVLPVSCGRMLPFVGRQFAQFCDYCNGKGQASQTCWSCNGRGYFGGVSCVACGGTGQLREVCPYCAGSGRKPRT